MPNSLDIRRIDGEACGGRRKASGAGVTRARASARIDTIFALGSAIAAAFATDAAAGVGVAVDVLDLVPTSRVSSTEPTLTLSPISTSGMDDPDVLAFCLKKLGDDNIMFAIDYPYEDSKHAVKFLMDAPVTANQRSKISHANAERFFCIEPSR